MINKIFKKKPLIKKNLIKLENNPIKTNQRQTNSAFTEKWMKYENTNNKKIYFDMQKKWYLKLYGFKTEKNLSNFLKTKKYIFDAGCGTGFKTKWFADLAPESIVVGMDFSDACLIASKKYESTKNLYFIKGDISKVPFKKNSIDYVNCDQVIMHTQNPDKTFKELSRITSQKGDFACYFYAKKSLPRELVDDYFRTASKKLSKKQLWELSKQLTELGKNLSSLKKKITIPNIPLLGIQGGKQDIQRFIYWNFLKCYWNTSQGVDNSIMINFDWYSPSNARRFTESEVRKLIFDNNLKIRFFYKDQPCFSGRFFK